MCGWQVKLCDPHVTLAPYLHTLETGQNKVLNKFTFFISFTMTIKERSSMANTICSLILCCMPSIILSHGKCNEVSEELVMGSELHSFIVQASS